MRASPPVTAAPRATGGLPTKCPLLFPGLRKEQPINNTACPSLSLHWMVHFQVLKTPEGNKVPCPGTQGSPHFNSMDTQVVMISANLNIRYEEVAPQLCPKSRRRQTHPAPQCAPRSWSPDAHIPSPTTEDGKRPLPNPPPSSACILCTFPPHSWGL